MHIILLIMPQSFKTQTDKENQKALILYILFFSMNHLVLKKYRKKGWLSRKVHMEI